MAGNTPFQNQQNMNMQFGGGQFNPNPQGQQQQPGQQQQAPYGQFSPAASQGFGGLGQGQQNFPQGRPQQQQSPQFSGFQGGWQTSAPSPQQSPLYGGGQQQPNMMASRFQKPSPQHQPGTFMSSQNSPASAGMPQQQQQQRPMPSPQYQRPQTPSSADLASVVAAAAAAAAGHHMPPQLASPMPSSSQPHTPQPPPSVEQKPPSVSSVHYQSPMSQGPMTPHSVGQHQFPSTPAGGPAAPATPQPGMQQQQHQQQQAFQMQQQQQQQGPQQMLSPAFCCRLGQESVAEIISRGAELFNTLKTCQVMVGSGPQGLAQTNANLQEKKTKVTENLKYLNQLFKRLRVFYDRVNAGCVELFGDSAAVLDELPVLDMVPAKAKKDKMSAMFAEKRNPEAIKQAQEEYKDVQEQLVAKNRQLKEIIDVMRCLVWEINTMLATRKP